MRPRFQNRAQEEVDVHEVESVTLGRFSSPASIAPRLFALVTTYTSAREASIRANAQPAPGSDPPLARTRTRTRGRARSIPERGREPPTSTQTSAIRSACERASAESSSSGRLEERGGVVRPDPRCVRVGSDQPRQSTSSVQEPLQQLWGGRLAEQRMRLHEEMTEIVEGQGLFSALSQSTRTHLLGGKQVPRRDVSVRGTPHRTADLLAPALKNVPSAAATSSVIAHGRGNCACSQPPARGALDPAPAREEPATARSEALRGTRSHDSRVRGSRHPDRRARPSRRHSIRPRASGAARRIDPDGSREKRRPCRGRGRGCEDAPNGGRRSGIPGQEPEHAERRHGSSQRPSGACSTRWVGRPRARPEPPRQAGLGSHQRGRRGGTDSHPLPSLDTASLRGSRAPARGRHGTSRRVHPMNRRGACDRRCRVRVQVSACRVNSASDRASSFLSIRSQRRRQDDGEIRLGSTVPSARTRRGGTSTRYR